MSNEKIVRIMTKSSSFSFFRTFTNALRDSEYLPILKERSSLNKRKILKNLKSRGIIIGKKKDNTANKSRNIKGLNRRLI
ncbi:MAG: hypothetical protein DDT41_01261 [candidate division WS2 bacterium]|nr:hypothetical protein [Candidatus Psychracetigena formicireducens]